MYKKLRKSFINIVLLVSCFSTIFSSAPIFAVNAKKISVPSNTIKILFQKFIGKISFGKKKPVEIGKAEKLRIMAAKIAGKSVAILGASGKFAISGVKFTGKAIFNTGKVLIYNPIAGVTKFTAKTTVNGTKYLASNFSKGYVRTFGQAAAVGTMFTVGAGVAALTTLATIFVGYKFLAKYLNDLNNKNNGNNPGGNQGDNPAVAPNVPQTFFQKARDIFDPKFGEFSQDFQDVVVNKVKVTAKEKFDGVKKEVVNQLNQVANPVIKVIDKVNDLVEKIVGDNPEVPLGARVNPGQEEVVIEEIPVANKGIAGFRRAFQKLENLQQVPGKLIDNGIKISKEAMVSRIEFLDLSGYDRNRDFRKFCEKIVGDNNQAGKCYLDDLRVATSKSLEELKISQEEFNELLSTRDRLEQELVRPEARGIANNNTFSLLKDVAWKESKFRVDQAAVLAPTLTCLLISKGAKIVYDYKKPILVVTGIGGGALVTFSVLVWQPALLMTVPLTLAIYYNQDKLKSVANYCKNNGQNMLKGTKEFLGEAKEQLSDDCERVKEEVANLLTTIEPFLPSCDSVKKGAVEIVKSNSKLYWDFYVKDPVVFYKNLGVLAWTKGKKLFSKGSKNKIKLELDNEFMSEKEKQALVKLN